MKTSVKSAVLLVALASLTACDYVQNRELRAERADRQYQAAMADYSAGRLDAAAAGFKKAIRANPANVSARFQLACLLQDQKQDYLGALCCYREYLLQDPGGDKVKLAEDRAAICEKLLLSELAKKAAAGDAAAKELADVRRDSKTLADRLAQARQKALELEEKNGVLVRENVRLRRMLASVGEDEGSAKRMNAADAKAVLDDDEGDRLKLSPDARALFEEEEAAEAPRIADGARRAEAGETADGPTLLTPSASGSAYKGPKLTELGSATRAGEKKEPPHETRPEYYVVEEGDTLYKISIRFYGRRDAWRRILEANKATISSDARIRTGQKLRLP